MRDIDEKSYIYNADQKLKEQAERYASKRTIEIRVADLNQQYDYNSYRTILNTGWAGRIEGFMAVLEPIYKGIVDNEIANELPVSIDTLLPVINQFFIELFENVDFKGLEITQQQLASAIIKLADNIIPNDVLYLKDIWYEVAVLVNDLEISSI